MVDPSDAGALLFALALSEAELEFQKDPGLLHPSGAVYKEIGAFSLSGRVHELYWVVTPGEDGSIWLTWL